jgi:hypothetical protein
MGLISPASRSVPVTSTFPISRRAASISERKSGSSDEAVSHFAFMYFTLGSSRVRFLKQRFGPVAPAVKLVHWICEEMDQRFASYSV